MSKRFMCLVLSFVMILSMVSTVGFAADFKNGGDFEASHVTFTPSAGNVTASINVTYNGTGSKSAVFWLGKYVDDVLVASAFEKHTFSSSGTWTFSRSVEGNTESDLRAYIWEDVFCGKAIAPVATYQSSDTTILYATKDGDKWDEFKNNKLSYTFNDVVIDKIPEIRLFAKDNSTKIIEPKTYEVGENDITVVASNGTEKTFTVICIPKEPDGVWGGTTAISTGTVTDLTVQKDVAGLLFGKPSWDKTYKITTTSASGTARITNYIRNDSDDARAEALGKPTYVSFDIAFTDKNATIGFTYAGIKSDGKKESDRTYKFGPNGKIDSAMFDIPSFNLNQWYNIAFEMPVDSESDSWAIRNMYINGVKYEKKLEKDNFGTALLRIDVGGNNTEFYMDNYTYNKNGTYDPALYKMENYLTVTNKTDVSLLDDGTLLIPDGYTVSNLLDAISIGTNKAKVYKVLKDSAYDSEVANASQIESGNILVITNGNGAYRYHNIKCKMELVGITNSSVVTLENADAVVGGDLIIDDADNILTVSELLACLNTRGYTTTVYADSTKATEIAGGENIPKRNAVLVTTRETDERVYNLKFKNLPDETGINTGDTAFYTPANTENITITTVEGENVKLASDLIYKVAYKEGTAKQWQKTNIKEASYISADIMFTSANEKLTFRIMPYQDDIYTENKSNSRGVTLSASGAAVTRTEESLSDVVPAFELNKWYNVAFVDTADGTTDSVKLYVNGVPYTLKTSHDKSKVSYGACRLRMIWEGGSGTLYMDNVVMREGTYNTALGEQPAIISTSDNVVVNKPLGTITVKASDKLTYTDVLAALTIDPKYDATVRGYTDSDYAIPLDSSYEFDELATGREIIVIAAKNGYSFEKAYAYYTIVIE